MNSDILAHSDFYRLLMTTMCILRWPMAKSRLNVKDRTITGVLANGILAIRHTGFAHLGPLLRRAKLVCAGIQVAVGGASH